MFWDAIDDFGFQKDVAIADFVADHQTNIWYIEFLDAWVTTDKSNVLNIWDLSEDKLAYRLQSEKINAAILDLMVIEVMKLVAVSSVSKNITLWDFKKKALVLEIKFPKSGIHKMVYSNTFQTLITAGFEHRISLWEINPVHLDCTKVGQLVGHVNIITVIQVIEKTPMVITGDEMGQLRIWDIRKNNCLQMIDLGSQTSILHIVSMFSIGKLCFAGSRINLMDFEDTRLKRDSSNKLWPIHAEYIADLEEIVICTRKDIQFLDANTGRVKKVYSGLLADSEDEIAAFRLVSFNKRFILGDQRGYLGLYECSTGELIKPLKNHANEVTVIKMDPMNKLIFSTGFDSSIYIQKEEKLEFKMIRKLTNTHYKKGIITADLSVHHSLFVTGSSDNVLYIWDYEYVRLLGRIEIEDEAEPTAVQIINGYAIIVVATKLGNIHFFHFVKQDNLLLSLSKISTLDVSKANISNEVNNAAVIPCKLYVDTTYKNEDSKIIEEACLFVALSNGEVCIYDINHIFNISEVILKSCANSKNSYNAYRHINEDFEDAIKGSKVQCVKVESIADNLKLEAPVKSIKPFWLSVQPRVSTFTSIPTYQREDSPKVRTNSFKKTSTNITKGNSRISALLNPSQQASNELGDKDGSDTLKDPLSVYHKLSFKAHKDSITILNLTLIPNKKIITCSLDSYLKIWELTGVLLASININHPLPIQWN